jgi:FkbM family methyltransferase
MHEIMPFCGAELVIRKGSVDRENVEWMAQSLFVNALRNAAVSPGELVVDLGAHIGSFSILAAKERRARVIAFEPDAESLGIARANALINGVSELVEFDPSAVGGRDGTALLFESTENWGHTLLEGGGPCNVLTGRKHEVPLLSLESALRNLPGECAFMKFNIEGAEYEMFATAPPDVLRRIRAMAGEIHYDLGNGDISACVAKLEQCGFTVELVPEGAVRAILVATRI